LTSTSSSKIRDEMQNFEHLRLQRYLIQPTILFFNMDAFHVRSFICFLTEKTSIVKYEDVYIFDKILPTYICKSSIVLEMVQFPKFGLFNQLIIIVVPSKFFNVNYLISCRLSN
jgi:hypothetical protein